MTNRNLSFTSGKSSTFVDIQSLPSGMYFVYLENETGILNKKIVVSD